MWNYVFLEICQASWVVKKKVYLKNALLTGLCFLPETYFSGLLIDYEKVLELDANNFEAKNELKKIDQVKRLIDPNIN